MDLEGRIVAQGARRMDRPPIWVLRLGMVNPADRLVSYRFKPGNPGRPKGCDSPSQFLRGILSGECTRESLEALVAGSRTHPLRVAFARELLASCADRQRYAIDRGGKACAAGLDPEPGRALARIVDRLEGTAIRRVDLVRTEGARSVSDVVADIGRLLERVPALAAVVRLRAGAHGAGADPGADSPGRTVPSGAAGAGVPGATTGDSNSPPSEIVPAGAEGGGDPHTASPPLRGTPLDIPTSDDLSAMQKAFDDSPIDGAGRYVVDRDSGVVHGPSGEASQAGSEGRPVSYVPDELTEAQGRVLDAGSKAWTLTESCPPGNAGTEQQQGLSDDEAVDRGEGDPGCSGVDGGPERDPDPVDGGRDVGSFEGERDSGDEQQPGDEIEGEMREGCRVVPGSGPDGADPDEGVGGLDSELGCDYPIEDDDTDSG